MFTALEHVALIVTDLRTTFDRYTALLGCEPSWHGAADGAECVRFQLDNVALEIVAPSKFGTGELGNRVRTQLERQGEGIWALTFAVDDMTRTRHILERRGVASTEARTIRSSQTATEEERVWSTSTLATEATFGATIQLREHKPEGKRWRRSKRMARDNSDVTALDHVVVTTSQPERAAALYGARLGLEMKLDRTNPDWGSRLMFFKCGDLVVEIAHSLKNTDSDAPDKTWGLSWRVPDIAAASTRMADAGFNISETRTGRKPGTKVFTVRDAPAAVPTLVIGRE
jgi:catechol 2,3-dioxygenase-like lactoylglutathione lyase family enzyme